MNKPIEIYDKNESTYRPGISKILFEQDSKIRALRAANEALCSSNANLLRSIKELQSSKKETKEILCAAGCMLIAVAIVIIMAMGAR